MVNLLRTNTLLRSDPDLLIQHGIVGRWTVDRRTVEPGDGLLIVGG